MAEDIKRSDLLLSLIKLEKDKGFVSLVDVIAAKKAYKEGKSYTNDEIIEALKEFDVHYTESEDGSDFDEEEPTEEELEGKVSLEDPLSLDDDEFDGKAFDTDSVRLLRYTIKDEVKNKINNYAERYGNKYNNYATINIRSYKGFIKFISPKIESKIDNIYLQKIIEILERGVYCE